MKYWRVREVGFALGGVLLTSLLAVLLEPFWARISEKAGISPRAAADWAWALSGLYGTYLIVCLVGGVVGLAVGKITSSQFKHTSTRLDNHSGRQDGGTPIMEIEQRTEEIYSPAMRERETELLFAIYRTLHDDLLPNYDRWCDEIFGPGNDILLSRGRDAYVDQVNSFLRSNDFGLSRLEQLLNSNAIFANLIAKFRGAPEAAAKATLANQNYLEVLAKLPDWPTSQNLDLVAPQRLAVANAIGAYGTWIRESIKKAEDLAKL